MLRRLTARLNDAKRREGGFTLIELLVVVLILGILSGIVVVAVSNARTQAVNKSCKANQVVLLKALDSYYVDPTNSDKGYPTPLGGDGTFYTAAQLQTLLVPTFLHNLPPMADDAGSGSDPADLATIAVPKTGETSDYVLRARLAPTAGSIAAHIEIYNNLSVYSEDPTTARCLPLGVPGVS